MIILGFLASTSFAQSFSLNLMITFMKKNLSQVTNYMTSNEWVLYKTTNEDVWWKKGKEKFGYFYTYADSGTVEISYQADSIQKYNSIISEMTNKGFKAHGSHTKKDENMDILINDYQNDFYFMSISIIGINSGTYNEYNFTLSPLKI